MAYPSTLPTASKVRLGRKFTCEPLRSIVKHARAHPQWDSDFMQKANGCIDDFKTFQTLLAERRTETSANGDANSARKLQNSQQFIEALLRRAIHGDYLLEALYILKTSHPAVRLPLLSLLNEASEAGLHALESATDKLERLGNRKAAIALTKLTVRWFETSNVTQSRQLSRLGCLHFRDHDWANAVRAFKLSLQVTEHSSSSAVLLYTNIGMAYACQFKLKHAAAYLHAASCFPTAPHAMLNRLLAYVHLSLKSYPKSAEYARKALNAATDPKLIEEVRLLSEIAVQLESKIVRPPPKDFPEPYKGLLQMLQTPKPSCLQQLVETMPLDLPASVTLCIAACCAKYKLHEDANELLNKVQPDSRWTNFLKAILQVQPQTVGLANVFTQGLVEALPMQFQYDFLLALILRRDIQNSGSVNKILFRHAEETKNTWWQLASGLPLIALAIFPQAQLDNWVFKQNRPLKYFQNGLSRFWDFQAVDAGILPGSQMAHFYLFALLNLPLYHIYSTARARRALADRLPTDTIVGRFLKHFLLKEIARSSRETAPKTAEECSALLAESLRELSEKLPGIAALPRELISTKQLDPSWALMVLLECAKNLERDFVIDLVLCYTAKCATVKGDPIPKHRKYINIGLTICENYYKSKPEKYAQRMYVIATKKMSQAIPHKVVPTLEHLREFLASEKLRWTPIAQKIEQYLQSRFGKEH